jgi:hypothetical protein
MGINIYISEHKYSIMNKPGRPKTETEMGDIHFTLEVSEKKKWMEYSEKLGIPLSKAIKESMDKAMYKNGTQDNHLGRIEKLIETQQEELNQLSQRYFDVIDELSKRKQDNGNKIEDSESIKPRILILLKRTPMQREEIETILSLDKKSLRIILSEMKTNGQIYYDPDLDLWGVN